MTDQPLTPITTVEYEMAVRNRDVEIDRLRADLATADRKLVKLRVELDEARTDAKYRLTALREAASAYRKLSADLATARETLEFYAARPDEHDNKAAREALDRIGENGERCAHEWTMLSQPPTCAKCGAKALDRIGEQK